RQYGGRGATLKEQVIYTEEMARVRAPAILDPIAVNIVGPLLIHYGSAAQRERFLPPILPAEEVWCLGFSEPGAGSDLAALRCRAERDGEEWVVSGQKVWSSKAHVADWCLLLVRTDGGAAKHKGISCLAVDMRSPGITWRPLVQLSGRSEFNELFLDQVRVPVENTIGPINGGWPLVRAALAHERGTLWAFELKIRLQNAALARAAPRVTAVRHATLLSRVAATPFYRGRVAEGNLATWDRLPLTRREELLRDQLDHLPWGTRRFADAAAPVRVGVTGSGDGLLVLAWSPAALARERAAGVRLLRRLGVG